MSGTFEEFVADRLRVQTAVKTFRAEANRRYRVGPKDRPGACAFVDVTFKLHPRGSDDVWHIQVTRDTGKPIPIEKVTPTEAALYAVVKGWVQDWVWNERGELPPSGGYTLQSALMPEPEMGEEG